MEETVRYKTAIFNTPTIESCALLKTETLEMLSQAQDGGCSSDGRVLAQHTQSPRFNPQDCIDQMWWHMPIIQVLGKWKQEDQKFKVLEFEASLVYIRPCNK